jgi:MYXO-CTERM domain-containing protein
VSSGAGGDGVKAQAPVGSAATACAYDPAGSASGSGALTLAALALAWLRARGKRAGR